MQKYRAFLKTVEYGSISRAAEALGYTQSAVSRMIADLEETWQVCLLIRGRGGLRPTSSGLYLLPHLTALCREEEKLEGALRGLRGLEGGLLRVGSFSSVSVAWLPELIRRFKERHPKISFQLRHGEYGEIGEWILRGEIDCGFLCAPFPPGLRVNRLRRDRLMAVLPQTHPLAGAACYPVERFAREDFIKTREEKDREIEDILRRLPTPVRPAYEVNDDYAILAMVERGLGVSILPELETELGLFRLVALELDPPQYREIGLAVMEQGRHAPAAEAFLSLTAEWLEEHAL
jgi:DNA-binding transcriptional LysR family regulator